MIYERQLTQAEKQNEAQLANLQEKYDTMTRLERIRRLGTAVDLSNQIARIEGTIRARRLMYDFPHHTKELQLADDAATDTLLVDIENK